MSIGEAAANGVNHTPSGTDSGEENISEVLANAKTSDMREGFIINRTPTPWHANIATPFTGWDILADQGPLQVMPARAYSAADAAFIVRACNSHDDLLAALKACLKWHIELVDSGDAGFWNAEDDDCVKQARAAIAKAEGVTP